ncbi:MAG: Do family serine endopeptidase [Bacteroidales bacterium]|nr:Do family serine endopeptidase [Bacteroidales bacterium]
MKAKTLIGNILIAGLSALLTIIIYTNFFQETIIHGPDSDIKKQRATGVLEDSNQVNYSRIPAALNGEIMDFTLAAENSIHAVVHVTSKYNLENNDYYKNPIYEWIFGDTYAQPSVSFGSGVIISKDGYIVTNYHVVENSDEIQIILNDKRTFTAEIVGSDPGTDLALLKVESTELPYFSFGNSDVIKVGEWVLAVGNPFNLTSTVTAGIVSAKARNIHILSDQSNYPIESYIQTDAAVNKGNSGGALVNLKGELVGINSAIISPSGAYSGYSFAIPVNIVKKVVADIINFGEVQRAVLGVSILDVNNEIAKRYNLNKIEGVLISSVNDKGAAKEAEMKEGDVVIEVNKVKINSIAELTEQIGKYRPGEIIYITVKRNNKRKQIEVLLRNMHGNTKIVTTDEFFSILGASFQQIDNNDKRRLGINNGIKITGIKKGAFSKAGIKEGFVIIKLQGEKVFKVDDIKKILGREESGALVELEGLYPGGRYIYVFQIKLE